MRFGIAASVALLWLAPALAQDSAAPVANAPAASPPADTIGPRELENFSLNGTVTREAPESPARTARPAGPTATPRTTLPAPSPRPAPPPDRSDRSPAREPAAPAAGIAPPALDALGAAPVDPLPASPGFRPFPQAVPAADPPADTLPWLLALLLLLGAGAGLYAWRRRSQPGYAAAGSLSDALIRPEPAPAPEPLQRATPPRPAPKPAAPPPPASPPLPAGIVSTRLRPWLEIEFAPGRCVVEDGKATVHFDVSLFNSGSGPARDVLLEASMFNAGPDQDQQIGAFFAHPVGKGDRIPAIPPLKRVALKSAVSLTGDQLRIFEIGGRQLFVPMIGFNALYRWSGGEGQTSASFLVGRDTDGAKMAPLRLDLGPRIFRGLGAREHAVKVRK